MCFWGGVGCGGTVGCVVWCGGTVGLGVVGWSVVWCGVGVVWCGVGWCCGGGVG